MRAYIRTKARIDAAGAIAIVLVVGLVYLAADTKARRLQEGVAGFLRFESIVP